MAEFVPFNGLLAKAFAGDLNLSTDQISFFLVAAENAPVPSDSVVGDITPIDTNNAAGDLNLTTTSSGTVETNGYRLVVADKQLTASGGNIGPFRYVVVYDSTTGDLISMYDLADNVTIEDGVTMNFDFNQVMGVFQILLQ